MEGVATLPQTSDPDRHNVAEELEAEKRGKKMDKKKAEELAKELAEISIWRGAGRGEENERELLQWLEDREKEGWHVAEATVRRSGGGTSIVWGMMVNEGSWEQCRRRGKLIEWQGPDEGWVYSMRGLRTKGIEWGGEHLSRCYPIIHRRRARGRVGEKDYTEVDQRVLLPEDLHWYEEYKCWGRWDGTTGRVEEAIVEGRYEEEGKPKTKVVFIATGVVERQRLDGGMEFIQLVDSVWAEDVMLWGDDKRRESVTEAENVAYRRIEIGESGWCIRGVRRAEEPADQEEIGEGNPDIEFICWPLRKDADIRKGIRGSRATKSALRSYYEPEDERCLEVTPAFFNAEVLSKYLTDPERYEVTERQITMRDGWSLRTYDINEAGQVHSYLVYLGELPVSEQLHWKAHNEPPKAPISGRAYTTDITGDWGPETATNRIKRLAERQTRARSKWWKTHDKEALKRYLPCVNSDAVDIWKASVLLLHQCTIENLEGSYFATRTQKGRKRLPATLQLLAEWLKQQGVSDEERNKILEGLQELNQVRNTVVAHSGREKEKAEKHLARAKSYRLRLRGHSLDLTERVAAGLEALEKVIKVVKEGA